MSGQKLDKDVKKAILGARSLVAECFKADGNEAETRARVRHIFGSLLGYDVFKHVTSEYAISSAGLTVHCDLAVQLGSEEASKPEILIELKRVNMDLSPKHLRQASSYAIDIGCDWVLLTNSREWKFYHVTYGQPPQTKLIESWDLLNDDLETINRKFEMISYKNVKKQGLVVLWKKRDVLNANNMLKTILSEEFLKLYQRRLKQVTGITVSPEDIVGQFRQLLNEAASSEMAKINISLPAKKQSTKDIKD